MSLRCRVPSGLSASARVFFAFLTVLFSWSASVQASDIVGATSGQIGVSPSGGANYSVPIAVPIGTTGVQPKIALQYSSQGGNGIMGMGWSILGQSVVTRCAADNYWDAPDKGGVGIDPVDYDDNDKFCLNGQRLMAKSGTYGADGTEYRTAFESFSKIVSHGNTSGSPTSFTVYRKSGEIFTYGTTADSQVIGQNHTAIRTWALKRITDVKGNYVQFHYQNDKATGEFYLTKIDYTGNDAQGLVPYNRIDFIYETRPDTIKAYIAGDTVQILKRLKNVKVYAENNLFHDYRIAYGVGATNRSCVTSITECATETKCFKPTVFNWSADGATTLSKNILSVAESTIRHDRISGSGDFNGDGLTDFYIVNSDEQGRARGNSETVPDRVFLSVGNGTFTRKPLTSGDSLKDNYSIKVSGDFNGDGLTDFYALNLDTYNRAIGAVAHSDKVLLAKGDGTFKTINIQSGNTIPKNHSVKAFGDFNGDGLTDIFVVNSDEQGRAVANESYLDLVYLSNGDATFKKMVLPAGASLKDNHTVKSTGDFNGDGLLDFLVVNVDSYGRAEGNNDQPDIIYYSDGLGGFTQSAAGVSNKLEDNYNVQGSGDFNGDGLTDIYLSYSDQYGRPLGDTNHPDQVLLSKGAGVFKKITLPVPENINRFQEALAPGDFNGDGLTDFYLGSSESVGAEHFLLSRGDGTFNKVLLSGNLSSGEEGEEEDDNEHLVQGVGDFNGDGFTDLYLFPTDNHGNSFGDAYGVQPDEIYTLNIKLRDVISSITNGHGITTEIVYKPLTDSTVYTKGAGAEYPIQDQVYAAYVVAELKADNGKGGQNVQKYEYSAMRTQIAGFGSLGFEGMTVTDVPTGIKTVSTYSQDWTRHHQGLLVNEKTIVPSGTVMSEKAVDWNVRGIFDDNLNFVSCFRFADRTTTIKRDLNGTFISRVVEDTTYDDYGYPSSMTAATMNEDGSKAYSKTTTNTYTHNAETWRLGRLTDANVVHKRGSVTPAITQEQIVLKNLPYQLSSGSFDVSSDKAAMSYLATYADLMRAFGQNLNLAKTHYSNAGYVEGRKIRFSPSLYASKHADVGSFFGEDDLAILQYQLEIGYWGGEAQAKQKH
ncbi:MAG: FG-GAP-like repeat-containing protein [Methyloligellaceae bacterium]